MESENARVNGECKENKNCICRIYVLCTLICGFIEIDTLDVIRAEFGKSGLKCEELENSFQI